MFSTRPRITIGISLFLSYLLIVLFCTPVAVSSPGSLATKRTIQVHAPVRYRDGEILVRFRAGISEKDKNTVVASYNARRKKKLEGDSGFEKLELAAGSDARAAVLQLLVDPQVQLAEPNFLIAKEDLTPNDPQFSQQWEGSLIKFGTKATPILSTVGAFTAGYNFSMAVQCGAGIIE